MTTKAPEERSRHTALYEINWRLKFESWQTFISLKIATDFLFPSLQYQLPSSPNILALKAVIISASSRQSISKQLCPWSCNCCSAVLLWIQLLGWAGVGEWGVGVWAAPGPVGQCEASGQEMETHLLPRMLGRGRQNPPKSPPFPPPSAALDPQRGCVPSPACPPPCRGRAHAALLANTLGFRGAAPCDAGSGAGNKPPHKKLEKQDLFLIRIRNLMILWTLESKQVLFESPENSYFEWTCKVSISESRAKVIILITFPQVKYHAIAIIQIISPLLKTLHMSFKYYQIDTAERFVFVIFKQHIFLNSLRFTFSSGVEHRLCFQITWHQLDGTGCTYKTRVYIYLQEHPSLVKFWGLQMRWCSTKKISIFLFTWIQLVFRIFKSDEYQATFTKAASKFV